MLEELIIRITYFIVGAGVSGFIAHYLFLEKIKFSKLHEKRATVMRELYEKLVIFEDSMKSLTSPMKFYGDIKEKEKLKISSEKGKDFEIYYTKNKIYFNEDICNILDDIKKEMLNSWITFSVYSDEINDSYPNNNAPEKWEKRVEAWKNIGEKIPPLKNKLEKEFRKILGVKK